MENHRPNYYEVLGIGSGASSEEIERAYRFSLELYGDGALATYSLLDPDEVRTARSRVQEAYEVLSDPVRRHEYDLAQDLVPPGTPPPARGPVPLRAVGPGAGPAEVVSGPGRNAEGSGAPSTVRTSGDAGREALASGAREPFEAAAVADAPVTPPAVATPAATAVISPAPAGSSPTMSGQGSSPASSGHGSSLTSSGHSPWPASGQNPSPPFSGHGVSSAPAVPSASPDPGPLAPPPPAPAFFAPAPLRTPTMLAEPITGSALRRFREERGITLREIANQSKIGTRFLEYIEGDRHDMLPAPVYLRGFLQEYARAVGLDPKRTADGYMAQFPRPWPAS